MRVGATSKSPMPASAGAAKAKSGAARTAADTIALMLTVILAIPTRLQIGATTSSFAPEWLIFGQPRRENRKFAGF
jgi:hypothetical protein